MEIYEDSDSSDKDRRVKKKKEYNFGKVNQVQFTQGIEA